MLTIEQLIALLCLFFILLVISKLSCSPSEKGKQSERVFARKLNSTLDRETYHILNSITLRLADGSTTQIDHVVVSRYGIFVIELKNYQGWIFGDMKSKVWTQVFNKHSKFKFQNPIRQNYRHVMSLAELTGIPFEYFKPIVAFVGGCKIKTQLIPNAGYASSMIDYIKSQKEIVILDQQVTEIIEVIIEWERHSAVSDQEHIANLKSRFGAKSNVICHPEWYAKGKTEIDSSVDNSRYCPRCGKELVIRTTRKGVNAGAQFLGCSGYPRCQFTEQLSVAH